MCCIDWGISVCVCCIDWGISLCVLTGRAYGNLGLSQESLGNFQEAIHHQEQHLSIAVQMGDNIAKTLAYSSLGEWSVLF